MVETLQSPFVRAARAHGISQSRLLLRHVFPVALNPLISRLGLSIANLLGVSLITEVIMSWPGLGRLLLESVQGGPYVVIGSVLVSALLLQAGVFISDLLLFLSDPDQGQGRRMKTLSAILIAVHLVFLCCGFVAPYDESGQNRNAAYAPPTKLHLDLTSSPHLYICAWPENENVPGEYAEDCSHRFAVNFFVRQPHPLLFGVDSPGRISLFGTDSLGRDQFSRFLFGARLSLFAGLLATALALLLGVFIGMLAGFYGGLVDSILMRVAELFLALPWIYLLLAARAFLPLNLSAQQTFLLLVTIIGAIGWARPARLVRGMVLSGKERNFVLVGRNLGATDSYLLFRHILPQVYGVVLAQAALLVPQYVLAEITLSFLGLGVGEPAASLGNLLAVLQHYHVVASYWWMFLPGIGLIPIFMAYFLMANALQRRLKFIPV